MRRHTPDEATENGRVLEAAIALVECDTDDDRAYRAAWERMRAAARDWLEAPRASDVVDPLGYRAVHLIQEPRSLAQLGGLLGVTTRRAGYYLIALRRAGVPIVRVRFGPAREVRYALGPCRQDTAAGGDALPGQRDLWSGNG
jgi:hypothetical protein